LRRGLGGAAHDRLQDRGHVDRMGHRAAHAHIRERVLGPVPERRVVMGEAQHDDPALDPAMTEVPSLASTRSASCTGTGSIMSTSPDRSAATAVAEFWIGVKMASVMPWLASPHQPSKGTSTVSRSGWRLCNHEGTGAVHVARGEVLGVARGRSAPLASAQPLSIIIQLAMESGNSGCGEVVRMSTV
jgi:hypothetical protein